MPCVSTVIPSFCEGTSPITVTGTTAAQFSAFKALPLEGEGQPVPVLERIDALGDVVFVLFQSLRTPRYDCE